MTVRVPLKETALNADRITRIAREVHGVCPGFDADAFVREVMADLPRLELKDRITRTSQALRTHLPATGHEAVEVLLASLPPTPEAGGVTNDFGLHIYSPHSDYVARYLRTGEHLDQSLNALACLTRYFTAELAVRHFLADFPDETMKAVDAWARHDDHRVRRLASEATRPLLPWAPRISLPPDAALPVLEQLYADPSLYVRTSVANHLHDLSVQQPELVLATLQRWKDAGRADDGHFTFIARQALRSRLKKGWPGAYAFLGYAPDAPVELTPLVLERTELVDCDTLTFSAALTTSAHAPVHVIYFLLRGQGRPGEQLPLGKDHVVRSTATVELTPGAYSIALQVNGRRFPAAAFRIREA
jgi:3-methyladenine DNA glycosylase AlkC